MLFGFAPQKMKRDTNIVIRCAVCTAIVGFVKSEMEVSQIFLASMSLEYYVTLGEDVSTTDLNKNGRHDILPLP
jgi:hypothetical protein